MKRMVLIAHDTKREAMIRWLCSWRGELTGMKLYATGLFGREALGELGLAIRPVATGSCGEQEALRRMIKEEKVDLILFFWEPTFREFRGIDPSAVSSMAERYDIPTALNPWTADCFFRLMLRGARSIPRKMAI
jgi:methylglyoxal synthase